MNNYTLPQTDAAIVFMESFSNIKRIIYLSDLITMCNGEIAFSPNRINLIDSSGNVKTKLSNVENILLGLESEQLKWIDFVMGNVRTHLENMTDELNAWVKVNSGGENVILMLKDSLIKLEQKLTRQNFVGTIIGFNKKIKESKVESKETLKLDVNVTHDIMIMVEEMLTEFGACIDSILNQIEERIDKEGTIPQARPGVKIDHRLRWNEADNNFEAVMNSLIENKSIVLSTGEVDGKEIMKILKTVFETINIDYTAKESRLMGGRISLSRVNLFVPEYLVWTKTPKDFKNIFGLLVQDKVIFVENFSESSEGESKVIATILDQFFIINKVKGKGRIEKDSLYTYLKK